MSLPTYLDPFDPNNPDPDFDTFNNPFFVVGNVIFGDLPEDFPGTPTPDTSVPEPSLIHGLLALAVGAIVTRCGKKK